MNLRNICYRYVLKSMGNSNITDCVTIVNPIKVSIGYRVSIHQYTYILGEVTIGNYVAISEKCSFIEQSHNSYDVSIYLSNFKGLRIIIFRLGMMCG